VASKIDINTRLKLDTRLEDIVQACQQQKRAAQKELFELYSEELFAACLYYANDYAEAQDVLHDGFITIFEKIKQLKKVSSLYPWMRRIMVNIALEKHRRNKYLYASEDEFEFRDELSYDITSKISTEDLENLIMELSPRYKLVFNLYAIEGYSHAEIGEMLGISDGTSKSNLARARHILQEKVKTLYLNENRNKNYKLD
jgi:RNA polymerase sigma-70 factor (ECF subfamily)